MSFSANPYERFQPANLREFIALNDAVTIKLEPTTRYNLDPNNATNLVADLGKILKRFCYNGHLTHVAAGCTEADNGTVTYYGHKDMIKTHQKLAKDTILKNS